MSIDTTLELFCESLDQSLALAETIGRNLRGGEVIELVSDIGGGKTTFVRGLAKGMGSNDRVSSPSFTLTNQYRSDTITMQHFDFYRLHEPGIMRQELAEFVHDPSTVTVVEWAGIVDDVLPVDRLTINITATDDTSRKYDVVCPRSLQYVVEHLA